MQGSYRCAEKSSSSTWKIAPSNRSTDHEPTRPQTDSVMQDEVIEHAVRY